MQICVDVLWGLYVDGDVAMLDPRVGDAKFFVRQLIRWYESHGREFPWRQTADPFHILIAEVLLQRTRASQVVEPFSRLVQSYSTPGLLASAEAGHLQASLWQAGLLKRAATLKEMAIELQSRFGGNVPEGVEDLLQLPGVGLYTASATRVFAFGSRSAIVDANVIRILVRFFGITSGKKRPRDDQTIWRFAEQLLPPGPVVTYSRALIDFPSIVCKPRAPLCGECPLSARCRFMHPVE